MSRRIAFVVALCGAANLAHAADIPGVLGDPGTAIDTTEPNRTPETTPFAVTIRPFREVAERNWRASMQLDLEFGINSEKQGWLQTGTRRCYAFTLAYDPETHYVLTTKISLTRPSPHAQTRSSVAELIIFYRDDDSDKAGALVWTYEPLEPKATSQIRIGNRTLQLTNLDRHHASFTDRQNRIDLIDAIMRGHTAIFSSHGPNGFIQRTFDLAGATAMAKLAAEICDASGPNPGAPKPTPTAQRKQPSQPTPQSQTTTTTQPRQQRTQTATQYEEDPGCVPGFDQDTGMAIMEESIASDDLLGVFVGGMMMGGLDC